VVGVGVGVIEPKGDVKDVEHENRRYA
jgi:hypothetical protein